MVAALSSEQDQQRLQKAPSLPSKKPRGKQVPSRYLSPSPSSSSSTSTSTTATTTTTTSSSSSSYSSLARRFPSPLLPRAANSGSPGSPISSYAAPKRSQSVDRRRVAVPLSSSRSISPNPEAKHASNSSDVSTATKMLITSTRSLSVSFQGEAFSLPISKAKVASNSSNGGKKATPERRRPATPGRDQGENFKPSDQHKRWPARARGGNLIENLSRSLNYGEIANEEGVKSLTKDESIAGRRYSLDLGKKNATLLADTSLSTGDLTASDSDSVSSGSTAGAGNDFAGKSKIAARGIVDSAKFWQETNSRLRRLHDPSSPLFSNPTSRLGVSSKGLASKRFSADGSFSSSPRTLSSPIRGSSRAASPSKLWATAFSSPSRGASSPSRVRPLTGCADMSPSILSFSIDLRRGKVGEDKIVDAHALRLLYNHYLQWRFVNARADASFMVQTLCAEKNLWNAWVKISELRHTVTLKRIKLLLLRQKLKLSSILKGQISNLEDWSLIDRDHIGSLEGAIEALKASTLRLPIVGSAVVDIHDLQDAVSSAVGVMQSMESSICALSKKLQAADHLVAELVIITANERVLLDQCKEYLSVVTALQVTYCSLRTHIIQVNMCKTHLN